MKRLFCCLFLLAQTLFFYGQSQPIKNVIVMIPDGTSTSLLSIARWYLHYQDSTQNNLNIDPYIRGLLGTCSSDAPIGDSAPTTSCYMTGQPSQTGFISTYPVKTDHDLFPIDATRAYQPLATLLEASKQMLHKSTGLVFTCEFPHATPADCAAHTYNRGSYKTIAPQMVYNLVDVVIGGGVSYLLPEYQDFLKEHGYQVFLDDKQGMLNCEKAPFWALFNESSMPYEIERDPKTTPSLAEMTRKAIQMLASDPNGFFLMVEGSKVDWAAHDNDGKNALLEFVEFDKACKEALNFANKDGQTLVVIVPDHGTGAVTIGNAKSNHGYDKLSLNQIMSSFEDYKLPTWSMSEKLKEVETSEWPALFEKYYNVQITNADIEYLQSARDYNKSPMPKEQRKGNISLTKMLSQFLYGRTYFGFTTFGHTIENVFYAMYHPQNEVLNGYVTNIQLHEYLCDQLHLTDSLSKLTSEIYADHHKVFENYTTRIDSLAPNHYKLVVKNKKNTLEADSYTNFITVNKKKIELPSIIVYMHRNKTFYLPKSLNQYLK
jgi:alkaline phosphatase